VRITAHSEIYFKRKLLILLDELSW
jgi:hypothetical protein